MVTLKNPFETLDPAAARRPRPAVDGSPYLAPLDHDLRDAVRAVLREGRGTLLVVGGAWPEIAFEVARSGRFVTLVDRDLERMTRLRAKVVEEGLTNRLSLETRSYGDVSFEPGAFETVLFYDVYDYIARPEALFKKVSRELRAGGELLLRVALGEGAPFPDASARGGLTVRAMELPPTPDESLRWLRVRDRLVGGAWHALGRLGLLAPEAARRWAEGELGRPSSRGPAWPELAEALGRHFVVAEVQARQFLSFELAELAASTRGWVARPLGGLVDPARRLDERLLSRTSLRPLATTVLVRASKERELGRVFRLEHTGSGRR